MLAAGKQRTGVGFELYVVGFADDSARQNLFAADVFVVGANGLFGGGSDDGLRECVRLAKAFSKRNATEGATARGIGAPGVAAQVAANDHLNFKRFRGVADTHHRVGAGHAPIRN